MIYIHTSHLLMFHFQGIFWRGPTQKQGIDWVLPAASHHIFSVLVDLIPKQNEIWTENNWDVTHQHVNMGVSLKHRLVASAIPFFDMFIIMIKFAQSIGFSLALRHSQDLLHTFLGKQTATQLLQLHVAPVAFIDPMSSHIPAKPWHPWPKMLEGSN